MDKRVKAMELTVEVLKVLSEGGILRDLVAVVRKESEPFEQYGQSKQEKLFAFISALHEIVLECLEGEAAQNANRQKNGSREE